MELISLVTAIVMLVIVPFGTAGAFYALSKFIKRHHRLKRYIIEFHTVFLTLVVVLVVVPLTIGRFLLAIQRLDSIKTIEVIHTVLIQILQVVQICNVTFIALKRARMMTRTQRQPSLSAEFALIIMFWVIGIALGGTPVAAALHNRPTNSTDGMHSDASRLYPRSYFEAIYVGLLVMGSLVMFVAYLSVRRHINSSIASTSAAGRACIDRVYTIGALAKMLGDNMSLQFVTSNDRRTTLINNPVKGTENGVVTSKAVVDNWISEENNTERYKSADTLSAASVGQTHTPVVNSFDKILEEPSDDDLGTDLLQDDDLIERLSLTISDQQKEDNLSVDVKSPSRISRPGLWVNRDDCSEQSCSSSTSYLSCGDNDRSSVLSHCKCRVNKSPISHTPSESDDEYIEIIGITTPRSGSSKSLTLEKVRLDPSQKIFSSPTSSIKMPLSPCSLRERHSDGDSDNDSCSVSSRSSRSNSLFSPTWSDKCSEVLSITSDMLYPGNKSKLTLKRMSSNDSTASLPPLKHTRNSPSSISFKRPIPLLRRSSSVSRLLNTNSQRRTQERFGVRDSSLHNMPEKRLSLVSYLYKESVVLDSKDELSDRPNNLETTPTDQSRAKGCVLGVHQAYQSSSNKQVTPRENNTSYEKHVLENNPPAVQIRVMRPSTEAVRFLSRRNGLVQELPQNPVLRRPTNIFDRDYTRRKSTIAPPRCSVVRKPTNRLSRNRLSRISFDHTLFSESPRRLSMQQGNLDSLRAPFRRNTLKYKETVVRRFVLAFVVNVLTQVPNVVLEMSETSEAAYCILSPLFQSFTIISFLLNPYIYVLGNKSIHKIMTMI